MFFNIRTDLAIENRDFFKRSNHLKSEIPGIKISVDNIKDFLKITTIEILEKDASKVLGKPIGKYVTLESKFMNDEISNVDYQIVKHIKKVLYSIIDFQDNTTSILLVGLGNPSVTPDALGSKVIDKLNVSRHIYLYHPELSPTTKYIISAIKPGVLGTTGIDTSEIIKGVVSQTKPNYVIAIDSLAAKEMYRITNTIQICNTRNHSTVLA